MCGTGKRRVAAENRLISLSLRREGIDRISSERVVHFGHGTTALTPVALAGSFAIETGHSGFASRAGAVLTDLPSLAIRTCAFVRDLSRYPNQRPFSRGHEISAQREESEPCPEGAAFQDPGLRDVRILGRDDQRSLEQFRRQRSIDVVRHDLPPNRGLPEGGHGSREACDSARERETLSERLRPPIDHDAGIPPDDRLVRHDDGPHPPGTMKREPLILTVGKDRQWVSVDASSALACGGASASCATSSASFRASSTHATSVSSG